MIVYMNIRNYVMIYLICIYKYDYYLIYWYIRHFIQYISWLFLITRFFLNRGNTFDILKVTLLGPKGPPSWKGGFLSQRKKVEAQT